jgi:hypothetical protein
LVKCSSGAEAMKPTRLIWVGMDMKPPDFWRRPARRAQEIGALVPPAGTCASIAAVRRFR